MIKFKDINYPRRKEKEIITNLPNEIWKDIDDGYKVSNYGRVLSLAKTTIDNPNNLNEINHKDEDKSNNRADNLEWCTKSCNVSYSKSVKIKQINPITKEVINIYDSANRADIAVSGKNGCILMCCKRIKYNTYKGFIWRFINDNDYSIKYKSKIIKIHNSIETIYNSVSEAAIKNNISASAIYNCLYGKSKTCGGYEWIKR